MVGEPIAQGVVPHPSLKVLKSNPDVLSALQEKCLLKDYIVTVFPSTSPSLIGLTCRPVLCQVGWR